MRRLVISADVRAILRRATIDGCTVYIEHIDDADMKRRAGAALKTLGGRRRAWPLRGFDFNSEPGPLLQGDCVSIEIDLDVHKALEARRESFAESRSDIIARVLAQDGAQ